LAEPIDCSFPLNVERNSTTSHNSPIERVSFCHFTTNGQYVDGTLPSGAGPSGERQLDSYCDAWTSSDAKTLGVAASLIAYSPSHQQQQQTGGGGGGGGKLLAQDKSWTGLGQSGPGHSPVRTDSSSCASKPPAKGWPPVAAGG
jgi:hypothetical protein